jgi:hypothetical protein
LYRVFAEWHYHLTLFPWDCAPKTLPSSVEKKHVLCVYNVLHNNQDARMLSLGRYGGGVSGVPADGSSQAISSFSKDAV